MPPMVDNPHPIETTGADPITSDAVRARVGEFFQGIDLSVSGDYTSGIARIIVTAFKDGFIASAGVNGMSVARIEKEEHGEYHTLFGRDDKDGRITVSSGDLQSDNPEVSITRTTLERINMPNTFVRKETTILDPDKRVKAAQIVGVRV